MRRSRAVALGVVFLAFLLGGAVAPTLFVASSPPASLGPLPHLAAPAASALSAPTQSAPVDRPAVAPTPVPASPRDLTPQPVTAGWHSANFFQDAVVNFYGTGLPYGFREVPFVNTIATNTFEFNVTIAAAAPLLFANVTIWGNGWPGTNLSTPISGFSPATPAIRPMLINSTNPAVANFTFDNYRFFWPGSIVSFNITLVGKNSSPSEVKSASNVSVDENYPGGFTDAATWAFTVASPWVSANFSDDIAVSTTPNVLGAPVYAPNPTQSFMVAIQSYPVAGKLPTIPTAILDYTVVINGSATVYSEPFGPLNHSAMSLLSPIGPYAGATVSFNITAWLPWEGGAIDRIASPEVSFTWSPHGGWWHPLAGMLSNLNLLTSPALGPAAGTLPGAVTALATDQPVTVTIHEPIENVTIGSAYAVYTFGDQSGVHAGTVAMTPVSDNTSTTTFPGLPPGARLTFYLEAKDIYGNEISSGNYTYSEGGPTNPALAAGRGLLFLEFLDLSRGQFVPNFHYTVSNVTWYASGSANFLAYATPLLPTTTIPVQLYFGAYHVAVQAFGENQTATITLSAQNPTPVVVFYGESHPGAIVPTGAISPESIVAAGGLIAAAVVTLPLVNWFGERRAEAEEEQRRITL